MSAINTQFVNGQDVNYQTEVSLSMTYMKAMFGVTTVSIDGYIADSHRGDLYSMFGEIDLEGRLYFPTMLLNGLLTPVMYDGRTDIVVFDNQVGVIEFIDIIRSKSTRDISAV